MVHELFHQALVRRYDTFKTQFPNDGRRSWCLRVLNELWKNYTPGSETTASGDVAMDNEGAFVSDADPMDQILEDEELGLVIRTDFSNDDAWNRFRQRLEESHKNFLQELHGDEQETPEQPQGVQEGKRVENDSTPKVAQTASAEEDAESDSSDDISDIIKIVDPQSEGDRNILKNISNIRALRLFNDVDIRRSPPTPKDATKIAPNPLISLHGLQEVYSGKNLWVYDSRSNTDECVRVVNQSGDVYGTASGDSWRARGTHICELQFGMIYQGLRIDFNGLDKWDYDERTRNLSESLAI